MENKDWYENWFSSPYYKMLYKDRDETEAEEFVETLIAHLAPQQGACMLDIACGEGRHALQLALHGYDVTGIDLSAQSIAAAKELERHNLHFHVHDKRKPIHTDHFDYAFNFFTSFGYFAEEQDHLVAANAFAASLKKDGVLVIDYLNVAHVANNIVPEETIDREGIRFEIKRHVNGQHIIKDIRFTDEQGAAHRHTEQVAAFTQEDLLQIFQQAGLHHTGTYGDYSLGDYDKEQSQRLIMIFKK